MPQRKNIPRGKNNHRLVIDPLQEKVAFLIRQGHSFHSQGKLHDAKACYEKVLSYQKNNFDALHLLGVLSKQNGQLSLAVEFFSTAIKIKPNVAEAHNNLGNALRGLLRLNEAIASYDQAIIIKPDFAEAFNNRGMTLYELKRFDEALENYSKAIQIRSDYADAYNNQGHIFRDLKFFDKALASYEIALCIKPSIQFLKGISFSLHMQLCIWSNFFFKLESLISSIKSRHKASPPFQVLSLSDDPRIQYQTASTYVNIKFPKISDFRWLVNFDNSQKIKIGYYSADFHQHAVAHLIAELFASHDRDRFEIYGFSFKAHKDVMMHSRLVVGFDYFVDASNKSDQEIAQLSRDLGIQIAIDLMGYTADSRTGVFAEHCAPIQVNYLGYPGTMAAPYIDYIVADHVLIPPESQDFYSEKIVYMPNSYQVNDSKRPISERIFTRQELGLPEYGFVFCCFNNNYKITPDTFTIWMRLLGSVEGSVLWLFEDNPTAAKNLRMEAQSRGIDPSRLVFAGRMALPEHLARHRLADLFLDTLPYNAHTTASDALWAGLPVLTLMGKSFAARVAGSLLTAMDLPELITHTPEEYEAKALDLALHTEKMAAIKEKVIRNRATTSLFNGKLFARHLEEAYITMHERAKAGLPAEHIMVSPNVN